MNILLTGFGPFPGAPINPTGPLVEALVRGRRLAGCRRTVHVFHTSYEAVDRELPILLLRDRPDVLMMFGLAGRTSHVRIETHARNALSRALPDAAGILPGSGTITSDTATTLPLRVPALRLLRAARATGVEARLSHDAGRYLCNYLCWRATEAAAQPRGPRVAAFVHIPRIGRAGAALTFDALLRAGESMVQAAVAAARTVR